VAIGSRRGIALGALIALALPIAYLSLASLVQRGIIDLDRTEGFKEMLNSLSLQATIGIILILIGISTAGRAAGLTNPFVWLLLFVVAGPLLGFLWFLSYAVLGGALGSPF
jgi:hypothetical protein